MDEIAVMANLAEGWIYKIMISVRTGAWREATDLGALDQGNSVVNNLELVKETLGQHGGDHLSRSVDYFIVGYTANSGSQSFDGIRLPLIETGILGNVSWSDTRFRPGDFDLSEWSFLSLGIIHGLNQF